MYETKGITWLRLFNKIGIQPMWKTKDTPVCVKIDDKFYSCRLVFTNSGMKFHLEPVEQIRHTVE